MRLNARIVEVHEVKLLLGCVEHGGAAIDRWGPWAADDMYVDLSTNPS
jgi:hypothetical protein